MAAGSAVNRQCLDRPEPCHPYQAAHLFSQLRASGMWAWTSLLFNCSIVPIFLGIGNNPKERTSSLLYSTNA